MTPMLDNVDVGSCKEAGGGEVIKLLPLVAATTSKVKAVGGLADANAPDLAAQKASGVTAMMSFQ